MLRSRKQKYKQFRRLPLSGISDCFESKSNCRSMSWFLFRFKPKFWSGSGNKSWIYNKYNISLYIANIKVLLELSKDENKWIRINVANNVNANKEILDILVKDKDEEVRQVARLVKIKCLL